MIRRYSELIRLSTFEDRFAYLKLNGSVGKETFGFDRYLNQVFYTSPEWKQIRREVILRDKSCDLAIEDREIFSRVLIHHMNPISVEDITNKTDFLLNPEYLITTTKNTHDAIHFGDSSLLTPSKPTERFENDTCPWRLP